MLSATMLVTGCARTTTAGATITTNGLRTAAAAALGNNANRSTIKRRIAAIFALSRVKCCCGRTARTDGDCVCASTNRLRLVNEATRTAAATGTCRSRSRCAASTTAADNK